MLLEKGKSLACAARQADMDEKTARKYSKTRTLPSQARREHAWRTRKDPFAAVWPELELMLDEMPGLEALTLFEYLQRQYRGEFDDGQLRTLQRRVRYWRATKGPAKEVVFPQDHNPGELGASDFTDMKELEITVAGRPFDHLVFHFVLTYSNWETGSVCFSESFESLSAGLQEALWTLGAVPAMHRTDQLSAAVQRELDGRRCFTQRYDGLMSHYGMKGQKTQPASPNENGDVEQSHHRLKRAVEQALLLRGSRDFASRHEYEAFLARMFSWRNAGRQKRLAEELAVCRPLPGTRLDVNRPIEVRVSPSSTIRVARNVYSVPSRLIGEMVQVRLGSEFLSVWYGQQCMCAGIERLRGEGRHAINYRHVIDSLLRKPGAFAAYRWREDMFPTSRFRIAYDQLCETAGSRADKEYLRILELAACESEAAVDEALRLLLDRDDPVRFDPVEALVKQQLPLEALRHEVCVDAANLADYDVLLYREDAA